MSKSTDLNIKRSRTGVSNRFKIVVIGLPNTGTTYFIHMLLNKQSHYQQTKRFKVYHCAINAETSKWREEQINDQTFVEDKSCVRAVIFEVIVTRTILELLHLLISPEDIILLVYDPSSLIAPGYMSHINYVLNLVAAHCNAECCSSAINSPHFPLVLMVGLCDKSSSYSHIVGILREYFHSETYEKHILQDDKGAFHFIDENRRLSSFFKLPFLRKTILTVAKPVYKQSCPYNYLQFEQAILKLYGMRSCLLASEIADIADQAGVETTEYLFEHFRKKGIILYYPKVEGLHDKIFISPQRIINLVTSVFEPLSDSLSLQESFMQRTSEQQNLLLFLLENLDLAVPGHWLIDETSKSGFYYDDVPYIIPLLVQAKFVSKKLNPENYVGVVYYFPDRFVPECVLCQLVVRLIGWFHSDGNVINSIEISREVFLLECKDLCRLKIQLDCYELIKFHVNIPPTERAKKECLYPKLLDYIQEALNEICKFCLPSAQKPVCHLECPCDHVDKGTLPHLVLNEISNKSIVICETTNISVPKDYYASLFRSNYGELDDSKEKTAYALALKEGKAKPFSIRILVVGAENSGKTCLVESLLGGKFKSYSSATQGTDITVCKFFTTNWLRVQDEQIPERLQKDFCSKLKATVMEQFRVADSIESDQIPSSSSVDESETEHCIPTITITPAVEESPQSSLDRRLSLPIEEKMPVVSMEDLKEAELSSPVCDNEVNAVIWDVSGQTVYHGLLPAFLSEDNVAIITFDASRDLYDVTKARKDSFTENSINRKMTACQVVCYWCKAIYSICRKKGTHGTMSRYLPTVFLVATHIDKIGDSQAIERVKGEIIGLLFAHFTGKPYARILAGNYGSNGIEYALKKYCFFVSNSERNPEVFCQLKKAIIESCQHIFDQRHPVVYLKMEKQLLSLNKSLITKIHFHEIAQECGFLPDITSKGFTNALHYFHSKGIIMHFRFIKSLNDIIVLSPQWLVKLLAFVIVAHPFKPIGSSLDNLYKCLIKEGVLYKEFFDHMVGEFNKWSTDHSCGIKIEPEQAMDFVKSFYIVAEIDENVIFLNNVKHYRKSAVNDKLYIVPSMLPEEIPEIENDELFQNVLKNKKLSGDDKTRIIYYEFPDGFVPTMTFLQVIAACIERNTSREEEISWLSRNHCKMVLGKDQYYYISLCEDQDSVCLIMTPDEDGDITDAGYEERKELMKFFQSTLVRIVKSLSKISEEIQLPVAHVPCPQCDKLHIKLDMVLSTRKRSLRCKTKLPLGYYLDLAEKANDLPTSQHLPDKKKLKLLSEPVDGSSGYTDDVMTIRSGGGKPTLPELLLHLNDVINWEVFAAHLLPSDIAATEIAVINKDCPNDTKECKRKLYMVYLQQGICSWGVVVEALEKSSNPHVALTIRTKFL